MEITTAMVKELREKTGAGILDCKKALEETNGDMDMAVGRLKAKGLALAAKKADRPTGQGVIASYVHAGDRIGVLVELNCETDFVARLDEFKALAHDISLQVAATKPLWVSAEDVPPATVRQRRREYRKEAEAEGKPAGAARGIVRARLKKFYQEMCLLEQPFIRKEDQSIQDLINEKIAHIGENIRVRRFVRFELGE